MARVTVEDCLEKVENRFDLVMIASRRARQLQTGGKDALVPELKDKPTVLALREIAAGLVSYGILDEVEIHRNADDELSELVQAEAMRKARQDISIEEAMDAELIDEDEEDGPKAKAKVKAAAPDADEEEDEEEEQGEKEESDQQAEDEE